MKPLIRRRTLLVAPWAYSILRPFVDCIEAHADTPVYQPCFVVLYKTEGQYVGPDHGPCAANWLPKAGPMNKPGVTGTITEMSPILQPLTPIMDLTSVVGGFFDKANDVGVKDYHWSNPNILTGSACANEHSPPKFESIHWFVADRWKTEPLLLAPGWCKEYASITAGHTGWRRVGSDIRLTAPIGQPIDAFSAVFGGVMGMAGLPTDKTAQAQQLARRGLIDFLLADSKRVLAAASKDHKVQLERHIDGIQTLSRKIGADASATAAPSGGQGMSCAPAAPTTRYPEKPDDKTPYNKGLMAANKELQQIALAAMRCGLRRVIGYDFVAEGPGDRFWPADWDPTLLNHAGAYGTQGGYHWEYWHFATGPGAQSNFDFMVKVEKHVMQNVFAPLLTGMKEIGTPDDNLLKKSLGIYGTQQTYNHQNNNHSFLVFGTANGKFVPKRSVMYRDIMTTQFEQGGRNINDFLLSVVQTLGLSATSYGDADLCSGPLPGFAG